VTKRQARLFFLACTIGFAAIFAGLTLDSHTKFPALTHAENLTPQVVYGKSVWHAKDCINCHTLFGEGAYYAPDLTKITNLRGASYLKAFLQDPGRFYSEAKQRRVMPNPKLSDKEIDAVIAFLQWIAAVDNQGWPPRPILVAGATFPGTAVTAKAGSARSPNIEAPEARGEDLFRQTPPGCFACHSTTAGVNLAGPSLAGIATTAAQRVKSPDYKGKAKDAAGYIRESIMAPNAYLVSGAIYSANGRSFMPDNFGQTLHSDQIDELVAYLMTLK
jgi:nitric oxide reductase subunit C